MFVRLTTPPQCPSKRRRLPLSIIFLEERNVGFTSVKEERYSRDGSYYAIRHGWHGSRYLAIVSLNAEEIYRGVNSARIDGSRAKMSISWGSTPRIGECYRRRRVYLFREERRSLQIRDIFTYRDNFIISGQMEADFRWTCSAKNRFFERSKFTLGRDYSIV